MLLCSLLKCPLHQHWQIGVFRGRIPTRFRFFPSHLRKQPYPKRKRKSELVGTRIYGTHESANKYHKKAGLDILVFSRYTKTRHVPPYVHIVATARRVSLSAHELPSKRSQNAAQHSTQRPYTITINNNLTLCYTSV